MVVTLTTHGPEDLAFMNAVDDWTPRMKREYLREQKRERVR